MKKNKGFTLIEFCIICLILLILLLLIMGNYSGCITRFKIYKAHRDTCALATAVKSFLFDICYYPPNPPNPTSEIPTIPQILRLMHSPGKIPHFDSAVPNSINWLSAGGGFASDAIDTFKNQLISNTPQNSSTPCYEVGFWFWWWRWRLHGWWHCTWRGPYILKVGADPWGNQYSCIISSGKKIFCAVISAGPNGKIETNSIQRIEQVIIGGDDILCRVY